MTLSGIEPTTFWLTAQCLNQQHNCVTPSYFYSKIKIQLLNLKLYCVVILLMHVIC